MNKRWESDVRAALDARLSSVNPDGRTAQQVLARAGNARRAHVRRKAAIALGVLMLALAAVACAAAMRYGVLDFRTERTDNAEYAENIVQIGREYENEYLTLSINEAVFDGASLDLTLDIRHKDGADAVYVIPRITARSGDKALGAFVESGNVDFDEGFFLPEQQPLHAATEQAGVGVRIDDPAAAGEVTWTVSFDILRPRWPIRLNSRSLDETEDGVEIPFNEYIQDYIDAYENGVILLDRFGGLTMYDGAVQMGAAFGESAWQAEGFAQRLIACGAFERIETLEARFQTPAQQAYSAVLPVSFPIAQGVQATITELNVTFARADFKIIVSRTDGGSAAQDYLSGAGYYEFSLLCGEEVHTEMIGGQAGPLMENGTMTEDMCFIGSAALSGLPGRVIFVPSFVNRRETFPHNDMSDVYNSQRALTQAQEEYAFEMALRQ